MIDDDIELCELIAEYMRDKELILEAVYDGAIGIAEVEKKYDLIILDVMLPEVSGFEVLSHIRKHTSVPVIMLTARGKEDDRIKGLELGADDYLAKPFSPRELLARIRAILRRAQTPVDKRDRLTIGDITIDTAARTVRCAEQAIELTSVEFDLLLLLLRMAGQPLSREELSQKILGRESFAYDRSIDVHISNLRKKLALHADGTERIKAIRSVGYLYTLPG